MALQRLAHSVLKHYSSAPRSLVFVIGAKGIEGIISGWNHTGAFISGTVGIVADVTD